MDIFTEQIARKNMTNGQKILRVTIWIIAVFMALVFSLIGIGAGIFAPVFFVVSALSVFLAYRVTRNLYIEFEYSVTNNILEVAKIVAKTHRKNLLTTKIFEFEDFGEYDPESHQKKPYQQTIFAAANNESPHFAIFNAKGKGRTLLVFTPNEKILEVIHKHLHPKLRWAKQPNLSN